MAKITKLEQQFKEGKASGFKIELSDGVFGYLVEKDSDKGMAVGDEVFYTSETPAGKTYKKITATKTKKDTSNPSIPSLIPSVNPSGNPSLLALKAEASLKSMDYMVQLFIAEKIEWEHIQPKHKELTTYLFGVIDDLAKG